MKAVKLKDLKKGDYFTLKPVEEPDFSLPLYELPYGSEFVFRPNGPIWVKCSELWHNRFGFPVISAFQGNHYAWHSWNCLVYPLPLESVYKSDEQLELF